MEEVGSFHMHRQSWPSQSTH